MSDVFIESDFADSRVVGMTLLRRRKVPMEFSARRIASCMHPDGARGIYTRPEIRPRAADDCVREVASLQSAALPR